MTNSPRRVALFDVCKTLVSVTTITDFAKHALLSPSRNPRWSIWLMVRHWMYILFKKTGISNRGFVPHVIGLVKGYSTEDLKLMAQEYFDTRLQDLLYEEMVERIEQAKKEGYEVYLVSAAVDMYLWPLAEYLGVPYIATSAQVENDSYTGKIGGVECYNEGKVLRVRKDIPQSEKILWQESVAYGDSKADIPLLGMVGVPHAVNPDGGLLRYAQNHNWPILYI